jgi:hypothetical protein
VIKLDESVLYDRSYSIVKRLERISGDTFHRTETIATADYLNQDRILPTFQHDAWTTLRYSMNGSYDLNGEIEALNSNGIQEVS